LRASLDHVRIKFELPGMDGRERDSGTNQRPIEHTVAI
jgi:hypothetical protein